MASASCIETPSDIRRLRAARLNFEAPSFSLGIDTEAFRPIPSYDEFPENRSGRGEEERNSLLSSPPNHEFLENCSGRGEEDKKSCQSADKVTVSDSEDDSDDFQISASQQLRRFKRLKRGPSSAEVQNGSRVQFCETDISARRLSKNPSEFGTQPHYGKCNLSRKTDISARRKSKDLGIFSTQLYKEPLPFVKDFKNQLPEDSNASGIELIHSRQDYVHTGSGDRALSSKNDQRSGHKRLEPESSLGSGKIANHFRDFCSTEVSKLGFQRGGSNEGARIVNREPLSASQIDRINPFVNIQPSSRGDVDVNEDDIEEFSDDGLFGSGSRTQKARRRSLRPQMSGSSPILLSSSPETSEKPVLHIPGADFPPKVPLRLSQPTELTTSGMLNSEEDPFLIDDFVSGTGWRRTKPNPRKPAQTPQHLNNSTSECQRAADFPSKLPLRLSQPTEPTTSGMPNSEEDPFLIDDFVSGSGWRRTKPDLSKPAQTPQHLDKSDDFVSGSGWRRTKPDLSRPAQTPQHLNNSTSECQRADPGTDQFKTSKRYLFRDTNLKSFYTETPARRDIVGPSQAHRNGEGNVSEENRIQAFLRQRFPHFKPVDALLVDGGLDNEPVYIDYRRQFAEGTGSTQLQSGNTSMGAGTKWSPVRNINEALSACSPSIPAQRRNLGKKKLKPKNQPKKSNPGKASSSAGRNSQPGKRGPGGSGEGKWISVNGSRVYIVGNQKLTGKRAYSAYKKRSGNSSNKKYKKRQSTKSK